MYIVFVFVTFFFCFQCDFNLPFTSSCVFLSAGVSEEVFETTNRMNRQNVFLLW